MATSPKRKPSSDNFEKLFNIKRPFERGFFTFKCMYFTHFFWKNKGWFWSDWNIMRHLWGIMYKLQKNIQITGDTYNFVTVRKCTICVISPPLDRFFTNYFYPYISFGPIERILELAEMGNLFLDDAVYCHSLVTKLIKV